MVEATNEALSFLEDHAAFARRQVGGIRRQVATEGFAIATFAHRTSRLGDPQLHTHCLIPNLVRRDDGIYVAFDANPLHVWAKAAGTVFQNHLQRILTQHLGVVWGPERNGTREMVGFSEEQLRAFSKRTSAIEARLEAEGELAFDSAAERMRADDRASLATRPAKDKETSPQRLRQRWATQAAEAGLVPGTGVDGLVVGQRFASLDVPDESVVFAALVDRDSGLCATQSRFCEAQVVERIAAMSAGAMTTEQIAALAKAFVASHAVVRLAPDAARRRPPEWSTVELRAVEDGLLANLGWLTRSPGQAVEPAIVGAAIAASFNELGDDQAEAVAVLCGDGPAVRLLIAPAGYGKTTALTAAVSAAEQAGRTVVVVAPTHKAVAELRSAGMEAQTLARLHSLGACGTVRDAGAERSRVVDDGADATLDRGRGVRCTRDVQSCGGDGACGLDRAPLARATWHIPREWPVRATRRAFTGAVRSRSGARHGLVRWRPIADLSDADRGSASQELGPLQQVWLEQREQLEATGRLSTFITRLVREWSIETGILERLYTIDRGVTRVLIEQGFDAALIPHGATDKPAGLVIDMLRDHLESADLVFDVVKQERPLSLGLIKELHALITRHEETFEGQDQFGNRTWTKLNHGAFKKLPNSPTRPDGTIHEYCPPVHVEAEMDRLVELHAAHVRDGVAVDVTAAWLHHRFAQIHPFEDGNGRVARAITNIVFIQAGWFPLVIRNEERGRYITALEAADEGDLESLVQFFGAVQRQAFVEALGLAETVKRDDTDLDQIISAIGSELQASDEERETQYAAVKPLADSLLSVAFDQLEVVCQRLDAVFAGHADRRVYVQLRRWEEAGNDWNRFTIIGAARALGYYANVDTFSCWARLRIITEAGHWEIVVGLHGLGYSWRGVVAGSILTNRMVKDEEEPIRNVDIEPSVPEVFQLNYRDDPDIARERFREWLAPGLLTALQQWRVASGVAR